MEEFALLLVNEARFQDWHAGWWSRADYFATLRWVPRISDLDTTP